MGHQVTLGRVLLMSGDAAEAQRIAERARGGADRDRARDGGTVGRGDAGQTAELKFGPPDLP